MLNKLDPWTFLMLLLLVLFLLQHTHAHQCSAQLNEQLSRAMAQGQPTTLRFADNRMDNVANQTLHAAVNPKYLMRFYRGGDDDAVAGLSPGFVGAKACGSSMSRARRCLRAASVADGLAKNMNVAGTCELGNATRRHHPGVATELLDFLKQFGPWAGNTTIDLYATAKQNGIHYDTSFGWHSDNSMVVLIMIQGRKRMRVAGPDLGSAIIIDKEMTAGDIIVIPAGYYHFGGGTQSSSSGSVMLSLGDREVDTEVVAAREQQNQQLQCIRQQVGDTKYSWSLLQHEVRPVLQACNLRFPRAES